MAKSYTFKPLDHIAQKVLKDYDTSLLSEMVPIPIEDIIEKGFGLKIEYHYICNDGRVLGETVFDDSFVPIYDMEKREYDLMFVTGGTMIIDANLLENGNIGRLRFTYAHELAHWILHKETYSGSNSTPAMLEDVFNKQPKNTRIEREADQLASALFMPSGKVNIAFKRLKPGSSELSIKNLAKMFEVSKQAMEIRLKLLNLI